jgi:glycosyltransferase involved in cell wall biosynthesis
MSQAVLEHPSAALAGARTAPPVSIGMPVFNSEKYIVPALESILGQSFPDFELIISDNASDDRTPEICQEFARQDGRIRYFRQPKNIGAPRNFNFVFEQATAPYFKWAAGSDVCDRDLLRVCKQVLDDRPEVVLAFGKTMAIDEHGQLVSAVEDDLALDDERPSRRFRHVVDHSYYNNVHAGLFRSESLQKTLLEQPYPSGDMVLIAELALYGRFCEVPQVLFYRRDAPGTATKLRSASENLRVVAPDAQTRRYWPTWRSLFGYFQVALRSPIGVAEKARICRYLVRRSVSYRRLLWQELASNLRG